MAIPVVGVDLSKSVFQLSVADAKHHVIDRKRFSRAQFLRFLAQSTPARLVMEGCGTSNYWGRTAQLHVHEVELLHAKYVKAYVRRTKTDAADADALVLADRDTSLHPIPIKSEELQALQGLHRIREQWKRARVARICEARALLAEFGISASVGVRGIGKKLTLATEQAPVLIQPTLLDLIQKIDHLEQRLKRVDHALTAYASTNSDVQALLGIQDIGITIATAFVARVPSINMFNRGRSFSSWLGLTSITLLIRPGGSRAVIAENLLLKQQLIIHRRARQRAPNLTTRDRTVLGLLSIFLNPRRLARSAIIIKRSTLLRFHNAFKTRKYRLLYSPKGGKKPGPKGPSKEVIKAIVEMKQRNPRFGCPRIAQQLNLPFGLDLNKDTVRRALAVHYKPYPGNRGPSWLTTLGHAKDSLWSVDLFRCESILLKSYWVMVVMDQYTRRIIGLGVHAGDVDGPTLCRMFNDATSRQGWPK